MATGIKSRMEAETRLSIGVGFRVEVFNLAYAKAQRWARAAYGAADMAEYAAECGHDLTPYYRECEAKVQGTFNRLAIRRTK